MTTSLPPVGSREPSGTSPKVPKRFSTKRFDDLAATALQQAFHPLSVEPNALRDYAAHSEDAASIRLPQPERALAAELGTSPESLSRAFAQLRALGCISTDGRRFSGLDKPQLQGVATRKCEPDPS